MRKRCCAGMVTAMVVGLIIVVPSPARAADASAESAFVARINSLRESKGLGPLQVDDQLVGVARRWTDRMVDAGRISHNPNLAADVQEDWIKLGENVGVGSDVDSVMNAFINSPTHYRNLVDPAFTYVGVGVTYAPDGRMYTTHDFMALQDEPSGPAAAPRPSPDPPAPPPPPPPPTTPPAEPERVRTMLVALRRIDL